MDQTKKGGKKGKKADQKPEQSPAEGGIGALQQQPGKPVVLAVAVGL